MRKFPEYISLRISIKSRNQEYQRRKKAWLANATPEQLAAFQEAKVR